MTLVISVDIFFDFLRMGVVLHGGFCNKLNLVHHGHSHGIGGGHSHAAHNHSYDDNLGENHGHSHADGSRHSHVDQSPRNMNVRAALIHVIGDLVQSIGVLIAAIVIKYWVDFGCDEGNKEIHNIILFFQFSSPIVV